MITIPLRCLAEYMTSGHAKQRTTLREYKYPQSAESQARIKYYQEARETISKYHRGKRPTIWLKDCAGFLDSLARHETGNRQTRIKHNARGLRAYEASFATRSFEILMVPKWYLTYVGVRIIVRPDLYVTEKGTVKAIKLDFNVKEPKPEFIKVVSQCMLEAAVANGVPLSGPTTLFMDVPRGKIYKAARVVSAMRKNIEAACMTIDAIWPSI